MLCGCKLCDSVELGAAVNSVSNWTDSPPVRHVVVCRDCLACDEYIQWCFSCCPQAQTCCAYQYTAVCPSVRLSVCSSVVISPDVVNSALSIPSNSHDMTSMLMNTLFHQRQKTHRQDVNRQTETQIQTHATQQTTNQVNLLATIFTGIFEEQISKTHFALHTQIYLFFCKHRCGLSEIWKCTLHFFARSRHVQITHLISSDFI